MLISKAKILIYLIIIQFTVDPCTGVAWNQIKCSSDAEQEVPEGRIPDIGRFPWLGIVQHTFIAAGQQQFAVTGAVLIHPAFAIASAEEMAKIRPEQLVNNTKLVLWSGPEAMHATNIKDYILHPQYKEKVTYATLALLELVTWDGSDDSDIVVPVHPVCLPLVGSGTFTDLYAVKVTDEKGEVGKEITKMQYMEEEKCQNFYKSNQLQYRLTDPVNPLCATAESKSEPCVWDSGVALITRQTWGHWKLLGFGLRGPACGAPARFITVHDYLPWINDVINEKPMEEYVNTYKFGLRRISPIKLIMYKAEMGVPKFQGLCSKQERGSVMFKDTAEFSTNKNFIQGFYFVAVTEIAEFTCAEVSLEAASRTNAAVWIEHQCHRDFTGLAFGHYQYDYGRRPDFRRIDCYFYFKSAAFIEFRFYFSFVAMFEVSLYGHRESPRIIPNPFMSSQPTTPWYPTKGLLEFGGFNTEFAWGLFGHLDF